MEREPLPAPIRAVLQDDLREAELDRLWQARSSRKVARSRSRVRTTVLWAAALVLAVSSFTAGRAWQVELTRPRTAAARPVVLPASMDAEGGQSRRLVLGDGSWIQLAAGGRLVTLQDDDQTVRLELARGAVEIEVRPGGTRRWMVETELARVLVVGTRFSVERGNDGGVTIAVSHGAVRVLSPWIDDAVAVVPAGERLTVRRRTEIASAVSSPVASATPTATTTATTARGAPEVRASRRPSTEGPRGLGSGRTGRDTAWTGVPAVRADVDLEALFLQADERRRAGAPRDAIVPLQKILDARPDSTDAALAAFTLGRLYDDVLREPGRAVGAFTRARSIGLPSLLDAEARARLERLSLVEDGSPR